jgi:hypothetical protein
MVGQNTAWAGEHPACQDLAYDYHANSAAGLREIARTCHDPAIARLYYNRAYHLDLIHRAREQSDLISYSSRSGQYLATPERVRQMESYQLYMALIEAMAPRWFDDPAERIAFLNEEYDRHGELAELRLKGYDHLADFKEREFRRQRGN